MRRVFGSSSGRSARTEIAAHEELDQLGGRAEAHDLAGDHVLDTPLEAIGARHRPAAELDHECKLGLERLPLLGAGPIARVRPVVGRVLAHPGVRYGPRAGEVLTQP